VQVMVPYLPDLEYCHPNELNTLSVVVCPIGLWVMRLYSCNPGWGYMPIVQLLPTNAVLLLIDLSDVSGDVVKGDMGQLSATSVQSEG